MISKNFRMGIATAIITAFISTTGFAASDPTAGLTTITPTSSSTQDAPAPYLGQRGPACYHEMMFSKPHETEGIVLPLWNLGLRQNKDLTPDEAKIITKAALLMYNRKDLQVGNITSQNVHNHTFYLIQIVDNKNNEIAKVVMNKDTGVIRPVPENGLN